MYRLLATGCSAIILLVPVVGNTGDIGNPAFATPGRRPGKISILVIASSSLEQPQEVWRKSIWGVWPNSQAPRGSEAHRLNA